MGRKSLMVSTITVIVSPHLLLTRHSVNFDAGPSWSGLMPISGAKNETRKLFFWFVFVLQSVSCASDDINAGFGPRTTSRT